MKDLRERFAKIEIQPSEPIVPYRETAVKAPDMAPPKTPNAPRGTVHGSATHGVVKFTIRASPLPEEIVEFVQNNLLVLRKLLRERKLKDQSSEEKGQEEQQQQKEEEEDDELIEGVSLHGEVIGKPTVKPEEFWSVFGEVCKKLGGEWEGIADRVWAFGPRTAGGCLLIDARKGEARRS